MLSLIKMKIYLIFMILVSTEALLRGRIKNPAARPFEIKHNNTFGWLRTNTLLKTKIPLQTQIEKVLQHNKREIYKDISAIEYRVENQLQQLQRKTKRESTWEVMFIMAVAWGCIASCISMCLCLRLILKKRKKNK
tara:strand:+ start:236 stop:643 length:408 start_codon:yes stop_codon:yes gene_type:complete